MPLLMESDAFEDGGIVPPRYGCFGDNLQPGFKFFEAGPRFHHYVFELFALDSKLDLPATSAREGLLAAMEGKVVGKAAYVGRFRRKG